MLKIRKHIAVVKNAGKKLIDIILAPAPTVDEDDGGMTRFLHAVLLGALAILVCLLVTRLSLGATSLRTDTTLTFLCFLLVVLLIPLRRGRVKDAGVIAVLISWVAMTWLAWEGQALLEGAVMSYLVLILLTGFLRTSGFTVVIALASIVSVWLLADFEMRGWIDPGTESQFTLAEDMSAVLVLTCILVTLFARTLHTHERSVKTESGERVRAEKRRAASEASLRSIIEALPLGMHMYRLEHGERIVFDGWNPAADEMLGIEHAKLLGKSIKDAFPLLAGTEIPLRYLEAARDGIIWRSSQVDYEIGGVLRSFEVAAFQTGPGRMVAIFDDVTERIKSEERLRESQQRVMFHRQQTLLGVIDWDTDFRVVAWNPAAERTFGYSEEEAVGRRASELVFPESAKDQVDRLWAELLAQKENVGITEENVTKDGHSLRCEWFNTPLVDGNGKVVGVSSLVLDVTKRHRLEERLRQAQKMAAVGQLAGGVAHDFNNILQAIIGYTEMVMLNTQESDSRRPDLQEILQAGKRASHLTGQLLAFARQQTVAPEVLSLNSTIDGMLKMLRPLIGEHIEIDWRPRQGLWPVRIDPSQLDQILANLAVNARDAMERGGTLQISVENIRMDESERVDQSNAVLAEYVRISVSDNGVGVDKKDIEHIFEPFFTTKLFGRGTGMGLATVYGIVKQNGGFIDVASTPGEGSVFKVHLPRYVGELQGHAPESKPDGVAPRANGETVLIVEDEPAILQQAQRILKKLGYEVLGATRPSDALVLAEGHSGEIQLLLTDVILPEMSGKDLADRLLLQRPGMHCLFMSGYAADVLSRHGVLEKDVDLLHKPFSLNKLATRVRIALDRAAT